MYVLTNQFFGNFLNEQRINFSAHLWQFQTAFLWLGVKIPNDVIHSNDARCDA